tara:strand:- start:42021 stop:42200 length:180 start_codon:yes stop_codon:yes gene_type:complete
MAHGMDKAVMPGFYEHWLKTIPAADRALINTFFERVRTAHKDAAKLLEEDMKAEAQNGA